MARSFGAHFCGEQKGTSKRPLSCHSVVYLAQDSGPRTPQARQRGPTGVRIRALLMLCMQFMKPKPACSWAERAPSHLCPWDVGAIMALYGHWGGNWHSPTQGAREGAQSK